MQTILWSHPANKVKSSKFLSSEIEPIVGKPQFVHRMMNFTANRRRMRSFLHSTCKRSASSFDSVLGKWKVFQGCLYIQRQSLENETDRRRGSDLKFPRKFRWRWRFHQNNFIGAKLYLIISVLLQWNQDAEGWIYISLLIPRKYFLERSNSGSA